MICHSNLLGVHPQTFSSFCSTPPQTTPTTCSLTGIKSTPCATPLEGRSGYLAESLPHAGYEPNTCIDVSSEHTPINYPSRRNSFNIQNDFTTTVAASENFDGFHQQAAASGSSQFVLTCEVNPWLSADPWLARGRKLLRGDVSHITSVEETCSKREKRSRSWKCANLVWKEKLHVYLEQKADLAAREECAAQRRLSEAESDMEIRKWEERSSDMALHETNRELESERLDLYQAHQWADQAQREKINLCDQLEMRNRLFNESRARNCQEIEELRRYVAEKKDWARQLKIDQLSMQQKGNPSTVSQLLTQIPDLQDKANSFSAAWEFYDPDTASSSGAIPIPREVRNRDSGLPRDTRNTVGTLGNVFESLPAPEGPSWDTFEFSRNLASSSCGLGQATTGNIVEHGGGGIWEPQSSAIPTPRF